MRTDRTEKTMKPKRHWRKTTQAEIDEAHRRHNDGESIQKIADDMGRCRETVRGMLKRKGTAKKRDLYVPTPEAIAAHALVLRCRQRAAVAKALRDNGGPRMYPTDGVGGFRQYAFDKHRNGAAM